MNGCRHAAELHQLYVLGHVCYKAFTGAMNHERDHSQFEQSIWRGMPTGAKPTYLPTVPT